MDGTAIQKTGWEFIDQIHHLAKVRVDYVLGAKWLLRVRLLADRTLVFRRLPGNKHRRIRVG